MIMPSLSDQTDRIIDGFDFEKVRKVMKTLNWRWDTATGKKVPSVKEMKKTAMELLSSVQQDMSYEYKQTCSTGGFIAERNGYELRLAFYVEEQEG